MATISIHRALSLINKSNDKINSLIRNGVFVGTVQGSSKRPTDRTFKTVDELKQRIQSDTDKVNASFDLVAKLKTAIAAKNLETKVQFGGKEYFITEVLAIKTQLSNRKQFLQKLRMQAQEANSKVEQAHKEILAVAERLGSNESERTNLEAMNGINIINYNDTSIATVIQNLQDENEFLEKEIDFVLSEINVSTMITVDADLTLL